MATKALNHAELSKASERPSLARQIAILRGKKTVQIDFGFGASNKEEGNLFKFVNGKPGIGAMPLVECVERVTREKGPLRLLAGLGAGDSVPRAAGRRKWFDLTMAAASDMDRAVIEYQGYNAKPGGLSVAAPSRIITRNHPIYACDLSRNSISGAATAFPIMQGIFATPSENTLWAGNVYYSVLQKDTCVREAIAEELEYLEMQRVPKSKTFVLMDGEFGSVAFRPLKPGGPKGGRGFVHDESEGSDVVWIRNGAFVGLLVGSVDPSSYTSLHMHVIDPRVLSRPAPGGHIDQAVARAGTALMLVKADEVVGVE